MTFRINSIEMISSEPGWEGNLDAALAVIKCPTRDCDNVFRVRLSDLLRGPKKTVRSFCLQCGAIVDTQMTISSSKRLGGLGDPLGPTTRAMGGLTNKTE